MKPSESDIKWCIENREFVNSLLEKRGGWQEGDWAVKDGEPGLVSPIRLLSDIWLPSEGDVLVMLRHPAPGHSDWIRLEYDFANGKHRAYFVALEQQGEVPTRLRQGGWLDKHGETPLIALLELLRAVEGKG